MFTPFEYITFSDHASFNWVMIRWEWWNANWPSASSLSLIFVITLHRFRRSSTVCVLVLRCMMKLTHLIIWCMIAYGTCLKVVLLNHSQSPSTQKWLCLTYDLCVARWELHLEMTSPSWPCEMEVSILTTQWWKVRGKIRSTTDHRCLVQQE